MLARLGVPFDSDQHLFEVKWDGIRALAFIEGGAVRIHTRNGNDVTHHYPELECLARLPEGTLLDGEVVVLVDGVPSFEVVLRTRGRRRHQAGGASTAVYCVFDVLYHRFAPTTHVPLVERREPLGELVAAANVIESTGVVGTGKAFFSQITERGLEGVVAKRLDSPYAPGKRSDAWTKFKKRVYDQAVVFGYLPKAGDDFKSLVVATHRAGQLTYAGRVGTGFDANLRAQVNALLRAHPAAAPLLDPPEELPEVAWVAPQIYCMVSYVELTAAGVMRAPVFESLIEDGPR
jgi:DNA ligase D-like protein (predicted ligase)